MMFRRYVVFIYFVKGRFQPYFFIFCLQLWPKPENSTGNVRLNLKILKFARSFVDDAARGEE